MGKLLIKNGYIVSMNEKREVFNGGSILIEDDRIKAIGKIDEKLLNSDVEIYDAQGKIILPGLVNTHVHLSQQLGRGIADDVVLLTWLRERIWPYESSFDYEDSLISSIACCVEMIKSGTTTFLEAGGQYVDAMVEAVEKCGLRACLCKSTMDEGEGLPKPWQKTTEEELREQEELFKKYNNAADGRIKIWFGLRTIFNNSDDLIVGTKKLADKYNTGIHMHVLEVKEEMDYTRATRGETTVEHLYRLGALGPNLVAAHVVWLTEREIDLFRLYDVKASHNPAAAMKVVLGFARIPEKEIGSLEVGKKADLIVLNPDTIHALPLVDPIANIVYAMSSENVESTMCNGKWLMKEKKILFLDEKELLEKVKKQSKKVLDRAGVKLPNRFPVVDIK